MDKTARKTNGLFMRVLLFACMIMVGMFNGVKTVTLPLIKQEFNIGYSAQGFFLFFSTVCGVLFYFVAVRMYRRWGTKSMFVSFTLLVLASVLGLFAANAYIPVMLMYTVLFCAPYFFEMGKNAVAQMIFTSKIAARLLVLHCCFGVGSMTGPHMAGLLMGPAGLTWQYAYVITAIPAVGLLVLTCAVNFQAGAPGDQTEPDAGPEEKPVTMWFCLRQPVTWVFIVVAGLQAAVEGGFSNWSVLYLQDRFGLDPVSFGASFIAVYYVIFTLARFFSGAVIERVGYIRTLLAAGGGIIVVFVISLALGEYGVWPLTLSGLFIAILLPTQIAVMMRLFGRDATIYLGSAGIISVLMSALIQQLIGLTGGLLSGFWSFGSLILYTGAYMASVLWFRKCIAGINTRKEAP